MAVDIEHLRTWIDRSTWAEDQVTPVPLRAMAVTLDRDDADGARVNDVPPCWHWLYFLQQQRQSLLGPDGHPQRGDFLPPVPLPRRMWAGSQIAFHRPLRVGASIVRHSRIEDVFLKEGRNGPLVFVKVLHEVQAEGALAITERHDIVYRDLAQPGEAAPAGPLAPADAQWTRQIAPEPVLLFRYSALTFNSHRIHIDRRYATDVEGYAGLVVHGPLIATLLLELLHAQQPQARVEHFEFRAIRPLLDTAPFEVCGRLDGDCRVKLWARSSEGQLALEASATLA